MIHVRLLGRLEVAHDDRQIELPPSRRARALLAWLAMVPGRHDRGDLAARFWPDVLDSSARTSLRGALAELRRGLSSVPLDVLTTRETIELAAADLRVDLTEFSAHLRRGEWALALALDRGRLLADFDEEWVEPPREDQARRVLVALARLAQLRESEGQLEDAVSLTRRRLRLDPLSEQAGRDLIRLLGKSGDLAAALAAGRALTDRMVKELGVGPSADTLALIAKLRAAPITQHKQDLSPTKLGTARNESAGRRTRTGPSAKFSPPAVIAQWTRPLLGRSIPMAMIHTAAELPSATVVLISGDAGIGKTSLAMSAAKQAADLGAVVLYGRCDEEAVVPYAPWLEALGHLVDQLDEDQLRQVITDGGADLARLFPELRSTGMEPPGINDPDAEPDTRRWRLFEVVAGVLGRQAAAAPVLLVLDDVHWADRSSVLLLRHVLRVRSRDALTVLLTTRVAEAPTDGPLPGLITQLRQDELLTSLHLAGLGEPDIDQLVKDRMGTEGSRTFVKALHQETEGNPFFVTEILRNLTATNSGSVEQLAPLSFDIPDGVKEVVRRRLGRLGPGVRSVLTSAAVIGRDFDIAVLEVMGQHEGETLLDALDLATTAGLIEEVGVGRYTFSHALIRSALYDSLSRTRRARLHLRVAQALRELPSTKDDRARAGELARHYIAGGDDRHAADVVEFSRQAFREAMGQLAYGEAATHAQNAAHAAEAGPADDAQLMELRLELGDALARAGDAAGSRAAFERAAHTARSTGDKPGLCAAALGFAGPSWQNFGVIDQQGITMLEEALAGTTVNHPDLRARLSARLAIALYFARQPGRVAELTEAAVSTARELRDFPVLAAALEARLWSTWTPDGVAHRLATADELLTLAEEHSAAEFATLARRWRVVALLEAARIDESWAEIRRHADEAQRLRLPYELMYVAVFSTMRAMLEGRIQDAIADSARVAAFGELRGGADALQFGGVHLLTLAHLSGDLRPLVDGLRQFVDGYPALPAWRGALGYALAATGRPAEAIAEIDVIWPPEEALPFDAVWLSGLSFLALAVTLLGDAPRARHLYRLLEPYAGRPVVLGAGGAVWGTVTTYLERLAAVAGEAGVAERHRVMAAGELADLSR